MLTVSLLFHVALIVFLVINLEFILTSILTLYAHLSELQKTSTST